MSEWGWVGTNSGFASGFRGEMSGCHDEVDTDSGLPSKYSAEVWLVSLTI